MSRADGVLRVVLTGKWFDMIESGEKLEEYRGSAWWPRLSRYTGVGLQPLSIFLAAWHGVREIDFHPYHTLIASRGYTSRTLSRPIKRIRWGAPRPEWSGDTVTGECFIIELGDAIR